MSNSTITFVNEKSQPDTHIDEFVNDVIALLKHPEIPNNPHRDLRDPMVQRLMGKRIKNLIRKVEISLAMVGYESRDRVRVVVKCESLGFDVSFKPLEKDTCGWLSGQLNTPKGYINYN